MARGKNSMPKGRIPAKLTYGRPTRNQRSVSALTDSESIRSGHAVVEKVCSLTNPFCTAAKGAKIPDDDSTPSIPVAIRTFFKVSTPTGSDKCCFQINPSIEEMSRAATGVTDTAVGTFGAWAPAGGNVALQGTIHKYRVVSFGARIYPTTAPTNQSGTIRCIASSGLLPDATNVTSGFFPVVQQYATSEADIRWISRPTGTTWKEYISESTTAPFETLTVHCTGMASSGTSSTEVLAVEVVMNIEVVPNVAIIGASIATPAADNHPAVLQAASVVHANHKGVHQNKPSLWAELGNLAKNALLDVAQMALPFAGRAAVRMLAGPRRLALPPSVVEVD